mmetsp:Transcript_56694/g.165897  ORF Transcript_56694/g.165897 Transcript_56694/m.165897 type:complete len:415 (-) Transcript_56694:61-1305(-)
MGHVVLHLAALASVCAAFRGDPSRQLVKVLAPFGELRRALTHADRDDFEGIYEDHVILWANATHIADLKANSLSFEWAEDAGASAHLKERARQYRDGPPGTPPDWAQSCGYECLSQRLQGLAESCKYPIQVTSIGTTAYKRNMWAVKIGSIGPEVLMAANIHGDETVGGQLLQRWIWSTCNNATTEQSNVAKSVVAWYIPMFNPDGFEQNTRLNGYGSDLNRDMPGPLGAQGLTQPETQALVRFEKQHNFVSSLMFHGGAIVCNTAWDSCYSSSFIPSPCPPALPRNSAEHLASSKAYCDSMMKEGVVCTVGVDCQTNGASWYQISGSVQDFEAYNKSILSMTMEISSTKRPDPATLPGYYSKNYLAIYNFMMYPVSRKQKNRQHRVSALQVAHGRGLRTGTLRKRDAAVLGED